MDTNVEVFGLHQEWLGGDMANEPGGLFFIAHLPMYVKKHIFLFSDPRWFIPPNFVKFLAPCINKFITENTLLNQEWIMDPKKRVKDIIKEIAGNDKIEVREFIRFKVGEGL